MHVLGAVVLTVAVVAVALASAEVVSPLTVLREAFGGSEASATTTSEWRVQSSWDALGGAAGAHAALRSANGSATRVATAVHTASVFSWDTLYDVASVDAASEFGVADGDAPGGAAVFAITVDNARRYDAATDLFVDVTAADVAAGVAEAAAAASATAAVAAPATGPKKGKGKKAAAAVAADGALPAVALSSQRVFVFVSGDRVGTGVRAVTVLRGYEHPSRRVATFLVFNASRAMRLDARGDAAAHATALRDVAGPPSALDVDDLFLADGTAVPLPSAVVGDSAFFFRVDYPVRGFFQQYGVMLLFVIGFLGFRMFTAYQQTARRVNKAMAK